MNTQSVMLDLNKVPYPGQVVRIGRGDLHGTTIAATVTDNGEQPALEGMAASLVLPGGEVPCSIDGNVATATLGEGMVPDGTTMAYVRVVDGQDVYSTSRFRIIALEGAQ
jgi:hypothetical protein